MKEAESHADEDKKRKEEIETRNLADQAVYASERLVKDAGEKLGSSDKAAIESAAEDLKKAIERNDVAEMKRLMEALNQAQHKAAEAMYRSAVGSLQVLRARNRCSGRRSRPPVAPPARAATSSTRKSSKKK